MKKGSNHVEPLKAKEREQLMHAASEVAVKAYAPYSRFRVGAAVLGERETFLGVNVENPSYGLALCAERSALSAAVAAGEKKIRAIAIACIDAVAKGDLATRMPCGACRQWMLELAPKAEVLVLGSNKSFKVEELLPNAFHPQSSRGIRHS